MKDERILSKGLLISVVLLLLNDFYLKGVYGNFFTGKLSDFAGLFAFPFFFSVLFPEWKKGIYISTAIGFILWKTPVVEPLIELWNQHVFYRIGRVEDYTDYIALCVLPLSYFYQPSVEKKMRQRHWSLSAVAGGVIIFSFVASYGGGNWSLKFYDLNHSPQEVHQAYLLFSKQYPEHALPEKWESIKETYNKKTREEIEDWVKREAAAFGKVLDSTKFSERVKEELESEEKMMSVYADSVNFYFVIQKEVPLIYHCSVSHLKEDWKKSPCIMDIRGFIEPFPDGFDFDTLTGKELDTLDRYKWKFYRGLTSEQRKASTDLFETEVLSKLQAILKKNYGRSNSS